MVKIKPFCGIRPPKQYASEVASRPYDVLNSAEAKAEATERSLLHIIKPEIDFEPIADEHSQEVYDKAVENFRAWREKGWLEQDPGEYYYIYAQTMDGRTQYGLTMCCHYEDYLSGAIKKHELTRPDKEEDRMIHVRNQKANIMFEAKWGWNQQGIKEHETMQNPGDYYEYVYGGLYNYLEANNPGASHAVLANAANSKLMPVLGNYMAYKIPDGTTLIDPATGKLNSDAKLLYLSLIHI